MSSNLFIITAPSGAGKTTLIKKVLEYAQMVGMVLLLSLVLYANFNDLYRWLF